ncbi:MAG TPA: redoxin domain-containing protein [Planctomycetaceae bacterium]|nr:redoxin domain-containing protein [Planctomycetaceae bacterium]
MKRQPAEVDRPAPDIDLPRAGGGRWRLADHRGRPVMLVFHRHLA